MIWLLLVACTGGPKESAKESVSTEPEFSPILPPEKQGYWDDKSEGCDDSTVYRWLKATIDDAGNISGTEGWYWFFEEEGFEDDCVDTFTITGSEGDINWSSDPCVQCDRSFKAEWNLEDANRTCNFDYEDFFGNEKVAEDVYDTVFKLDPLSPSGNVNEKTIAYLYAKVVGTNSYVGDNDWARGSFTPTTEGDYTKGAVLDMENLGGDCVDIN
jgi:hypothetical protein